MASTTKICKKCSIEKPIQRFGKGRNACNYCRHKKYVTVWVKNHRQHMTELMREWRHNNPDKVRITRYKRRSLLRAAEGSFSTEEWQKLCQEYNHCCAKCHQNKKLTPDHIKPLSKCGSNFITNIQPLCLSCNSAKFTQEIRYDRKVG